MYFFFNYIAFISHQSNNFITSTTNLIVQYVNKFQLILILRYTYTKIILTIICLLEKLEYKFKIFSKILHRIVFLTLLFANFIIHMEIIIY